MSDDQILFLAMGGTIDADKYGNPIPDICTFNDANGKSAALEIAKKIGGDKIVGEIFCLKDSKEISKKDIRQIIEKINNSEQKQVIITIGTDNSVSAARIIKRHLKQIKNKTVIITGAMWPVANGEISDGPKNVAAAISRISELDSGVYVLGKQLGSNEPGIFEADNVKKNFEAKVFEPFDRGQIYSWQK